MQAAVIITYVCCGLAVLMTLFFLLAAAFIGSLIADEFADGDVAEIGLYLVGSALVSIATSVLAVWFAWHTWRRKQWARVGLAVCSGVAAALSVVAIGPETFVVMPGGVAVLVLLFVPPSNGWFRTAG